MYKPTKTLCLCRGYNNFEKPCENKGRLARKRDGTTFIGWCGPCLKRHSYRCCRCNKLQYNTGDRSNHLCWDCYDDIEQRDV